MFIWQYSDFEDVDGEVENHFPFSKPRKDQLETISEIKKAIEDGYKYIVLEAGTGTGKSAIAATLASIYDSSYILTVTKQLQDQYLYDFDDFQLVKGRSNFKCRKYAEESISQSCDNGMCIVEGHNCKYSLKKQLGNEITYQNTCEYYYQKYLALNAKTVISNYSYLFLELNYVGDFSKRTLLVCDEAHNLENTIMNQLSLEFSKNDLKEYLSLEVTDDMLYTLNDGDVDVWIGFIENIRDKYQIELDKIIDIPNRPHLNEKISFIKQQINDCNHFIAQIAYDPYIWIFDYNDDYGILEFKPLRIDNYAKETLFKYCDICLFMSATILDYRLFAHWLGISQEEIYPIRRKSPFDFKRNPIKTYDEFNLSKKYLSVNAYRTVDTVKLILEKHRNDKGIIHTVSNQCKDFLVENLNSPRLIEHNSQNRAEQLEKYKNSDDALVLISPSMNEGVDLPDDLCRFQIMYKIPYPDLGDKQTRLRSSSEEVWYDYKTALALVQTYGRGMRNDEDFCKTYFIDNRIREFVKRDSFSNNFLPDSFKKAIGITPAVIKEETQDYFWDEEHQEKINRKYKVAMRADQFLKDKNYEGAIKFYNALLHHELFVNDYHPYLKLSRAYRGAELYENEVEIITRFFKSGIYCSDSKLEWFKNRLKELSDMGYFDVSQIELLERDYMENGAKNSILANQPVPQAVKIRKNKRILEKHSKMKYPPQFFDDICEFDSSLSYDEKINFKYKLIKYGSDLIENNEFDKAIGFYTRLITHKLFINDYYPFKMLSIAYRKNKEYENEAELLAEFFKSGRYCNKKQLAWFKKRLKDLSRFGNFDYNMIDELENEYNHKGAYKKSMSNKPVMIAERVVNLNQTKRNQVKSDDYMKEYFKSMRN